MRDNRRILAIVCGGVIVPIALVLLIRTSEPAAGLVLFVPWLNWSLYAIGALCVALLCVLGGHMMRNYWLLVAAIGAIYWALGCMVGGMQTGVNPQIQPAEALPYIRGLWLLSGATLIVSTMAILRDIIRIVH